MPVNVEITVDIDEAKKMLAKVGRRMDTRVVGKLIGMGLVEWVDNQFRTEGRQGGKPWKELKPNTIYTRRKGSSRVLQDTGRLKQSFTGPPNPQLKGSGDRLTITVGSSDKKAEWHEEGTKPYTITPRNRKFLTIPDPGGPVKFKEGALKGKRGWFSRGVRHPGLPARPMLPTKRQASQVGIRTLNAYVQQILRSVNK